MIGKAWQIDDQQGLVADVADDETERVVPAARRRVSEVFDNRKLIRDLVALYRELTHL